MFCSTPAFRESRCSNLRAYDCQLNGTSSCCASVEVGQPALGKNVRLLLGEGLMPNRRSNSWIDIRVDAWLLRSSGEWWRRGGSLGPWQAINWTSLFRPMPRFSDLSRFGWQCLIEITGLFFNRLLRHWERRKYTRFQFGRSNTGSSQNIQAWLYYLPPERLPLFAPNKVSIKGICG